VNVLEATGQPISMKILMVKNIVFDLGNVLISFKPSNILKE